MVSLIEKPIPVLVVSGFLGSGKTTLVRHLLEDAQLRGERIAVISNEFGALGIDRALLGTRGDAYVELEGGCVCCQLSDELRDTLQMLRESVNPDRVIVETSGVALPSDTQLQFWRDPVCQWIEDDVAVVVVNAEHLQEGDDLHGTFEDQVSSADLLLLNKIDLVSQRLLPQLEAVLGEMAPGTPIIRCQHAGVEPALLFPPDIDGLRLQRRLNGGVQTFHDHEEFIAEERAIEPGMPDEVLVDRLRDLGALRVKGFVQTSRGLQLVQGVGQRIELSDVSSLPPTELIGRVVIIRRDAQVDRNHS